MKIKKFSEFNEAISGQEIMAGRPRIQGIDGAGPSALGPNYGETSYPNTVNTSHTSVIYSDITSKLYTYEDYQELYNEYLKKNGTPLENKFNKENLERILTFKPQI